MTHMLGFKQLIFIIATVFLLAVGQILFKVAAEKIDIAGQGIVASLLLNTSLIIALVVYAVATFCWLMVLKGMPLRLAYPFAALGFFIVPLLSYLFLGEPLRASSFIGAAIIMVGIYVSLL
jgi:multidrug transporter EmrE-like cation transporter